MRLKTQFRFLSVISAVAPLLATALLGMAAVRANLVSGPRRQLVETRDALERVIDAGAGDAALGEVLRRAKGVSLVLEDSGLVPRAWNSGEAEAYASRGPAGLAQCPGGFFMIRFLAGGESYYLVLVQLRPEALRESSMAAISPFILLFLVLLFLVPLLTSLWLDRTLKVVQELRVATLRISGGDLDFRPDAEGPEEIAGLSRSFDEMRLALREESERRARFLMSVSHDLKTPLAVVRGYVEALRDGHGATAEQRDRYLSIVEGKTMLLESRIRDLVDFASLSTDDWRLTRRPVDIAGYLSARAEEFADEAAVFGRRFAHEIRIEQGTLAMLDVQLFGRSLENLFFNAIKFTGEGGEIRMSCRPVEGGAELSFSDDGPGIPAPDRERVFEPYYRGVAAAGIPGSGLGLSIVKSIMEAHGFSVAVGGNDGGGRGAVISIRVATLL
jgi:signal transduction histidine kinase